MTETTAYQVLARKYRPQTFADLIGQDAMVRTLRNAFAADRIAHAFVLTGVRGVGKTTTARIVAKGLNCIGADGTGAPTVEPCGLCGPCKAIAEGRHVDVLEYDSASNTQVDKMREILASVPYRPTEARSKILIFDEVHMLSAGSFNALLKTLEEPPAHVKFIFATTEIRKVPVTILSRCQRFDLRRIEPETMHAHLDTILAREGVSVAPEALGMIVRAAEGSVRDALSLLDQAIAIGAGQTDAAQVREMLGLADRGRVMDLFEKVVSGDAPGALSELGAQYADGADPVAILRDLAEVTHWVSVVKVAPDAVEDPSVTPDERSRGRDLAERLPRRVLSRLWQMLLKALEEAPLAPNAMMAAEMAMIRLTHVADLPDPETLIRQLTEASPAPAQAGAAQAPTTAPAAGSPMAVQVTPPLSSARSGSAGAAVAQPARAVAAEPAPDPLPPDFEALLALIRERRDLRLLTEIEDSVRLVRYAPGLIEFEPGPGAAPDLAARLGQSLQRLTGRRWGIAVQGGGGAPSLREARSEAQNAAEAEAKLHPLVAAVLAAFPGAKIAEVRPPEAASMDGGAAAPRDDAAFDLPDDWDPFEDD
jgi:DNA polymerase III subunit gamma/tau